MLQTWHSKLSKRSEAGFTLVELLAVIAIIGILATLLSVNSSNTRVRLRDTQRKHDLRTIQSAIELEYNTTGLLPQVASGSGIGDSRSGQDWISGLTPAYIQRVPVDPKNDSTYYYRYGSGQGTQVGAYFLEARLEGKDTVTQTTDPGDSLSAPATFTTATFPKNSGIYIRFSQGPVN